MTQEFIVRPLTPSEMRLCPPLSARRFGFGEVDQIAPWVIQTIDIYGGFALGAFVGDKLIGYHVSFPAHRRGQQAIMSLQLAVATAYESRGVGMALRLEQRAAARAAGYDVMYGLTTSVASRTLYLYLTKLGGRVIGLHPDLYVPSVSPESPSKFTDVVEIEYRLNDDITTRTTASGAQTLTRTHQPGGGIRKLHPTSPPAPATLSEAAYLVELPWDRDALWQRDKAAASTWSLLVRDLYGALLASGYVGTHVVRIEEQRSFVQFERTSLQFTPSED
jgi:predicted GNAT superfamily acetyltransferase